MKNAPSDEPTHNHDHDHDHEHDHAHDHDHDDVQQPSIVAGVGSSALGSVDIEPQQERHPDNDGETVEDK